MIVSALTRALTVALTGAVTAASGAAVGFPDENRVALWLTRNVDTNSYSVPNSWAATPHHGSLLKNSGHMAGSTMGAAQNFFGNNATLTADQTGPDGFTSAVRALATSANGAVLSTGQTIPAGTWTLVVPIKSNTGSSQSVKVGQSSTLTSHTVTTSWAEYVGVFTMGSPGGGLTIVRDDGSNTMDVLYGEPRMYSGDVSSAVPAAQPLAGHLVRGFHEQPTLSGTAYWAMSGTQHFTPQFDAGVNFTTGAATHFVICRRTSNPGSVAAAFGLRANITRHSFGFRGLGRLFHGDGFAQTKHQQAVLLANRGWQVLGVVVDPVANERRFYVGRQLVQILSGIGSNTGTTDRDFVVGLCAGSGLAGDWMGGGLYNRALDESEWADLVTACEAEIVEHGQTVGDTLEVEVFDGDSITSDNAGEVNYYSSQVAALYSTPRLIINLAVPGDDIDDVNGRRTTRQRYLSDVANRDYTLTFWATNNVETGGYPATYASVGQQIINNATTDGFTNVIACTLTPKTQAGYNANRATVNTSIRAFTGATICDLAANASYGDDADASNGTLYPDGSHPAAVVHGYMATDVATARNAL